MDEPKDLAEFYATIHSTSLEQLELFGFYYYNTYNTLVEILNQRRLASGIGELKPLEQDEAILLLPSTWYYLIPKGFSVISIEGAREKFSRLTHRLEPHNRYGCLPYGITLPISTLENVL